MTFLGGILEHVKIQVLTISGKDDNPRVYLDQRLAMKGFGGGKSWNGGTGSTNSQSFWTFDLLYVKNKTMVCECNMWTL